ncbi:MAG: tRNA (N(6)-L-threonylcarbamoyladenosine(37)-C(2))-methylthiotransferase [Candidatus Bathyarchaeota archaeon]|nr:tRNA (N(6)-L-threonylcarbamoyladenosine(37)-C(2))-methylthiotransferase [Candidatus Bathyarchaeota archaeon]
MTQKVHIKTYGCSSNTADTETLAGCLQTAGYTLTDNQTEADLIIYNTCAVKGPTENHIINDIKHAPNGKKIIVAGCLPRISYERLTKESHFDAAVGPAIGKKIVEVAERVLRGEHIVDLTVPQEIPQLTLPKMRKNSAVSIVPINFGCLGSCAYCCVVQARGKLRSYSIEEITARIQADFAEGAREFWLTSQDTASYGRDIKTDLAALLCKVGNLEGDFRVRVGMMTPNLVSDIQERLIAAFESPKIFKFLHLPVQSGDDAVLRGMRRFYTAEEFKGIVEAFREMFPDLTLATDVIVGYPGETEQAFENTLQLMREVEPDVTNVSKFFARPKTAAWELHEGLVDKEQTKRRSTVAAELARQIAAKRNRCWVGWIGEVIFDEQGKVEDSWVGRNFAYKPIAVKSQENLLGKTVKVEVTQAAETYLKGKIAEDHANDELGYIAI